MKHLILFGVTFLFFSWDALAQFSLQGDIRSRAEFRHGYRRMPESFETPAGQVSQRSRLILNFGSDQVSTRLSFQDVRIWGQQLALTHQPSFDLHEAWVKVDFTPSFAVKAGRQEIRYDNQRFFAINDWHPSGQKHDALVMRFTSETSKLHLGAAFNQSGDRLFGTQYYLNNYKTLNYLWFNNMLGNNGQLSVLAVADGYEDPEDPRTLRMRGTGSAFLEFSNQHNSFQINPAFQFGKTPSGQDISAFYFMIQATRKVSERFSAILGIEWLSGNKEPAQIGKYRAFDPLYGAGHTVHGYMNYFSNITASTRGLGLINPYLRNFVMIGERSALELDAHLFFTHGEYSSWADSFDKYLGTEIDLTYHYQMNEMMQFVFGYSVMFGSETLEVIHGGNKDTWAHWAFVMMRVRPKFL